VVSVTDSYGRIRDFLYRIEKKEKIINFPSSSMEDEHSIRHHEYTVIAIRL
jgi:hypothetical protein